MKTKKREKREKRLRLTVTVDFDKYPADLRRGIVDALVALGQSAPSLGYLTETSKGKLVSIEANFREPAIDTRYTLHGWEA